MSASGLREWIRDAQDGAYREHIIAFTAASPRTEVRDLYGPLNAARANCPVQKGSQSEIAGFEDFRTMPVFSERPLFSLLGFAEVRAGFGAAEIFSSSIHNETIGQVWGETLLGKDGQDHRRYRELISHAFRRRALEPIRGAIVEPIVAGLVDRFADRGSADLVNELTTLFPVYVIAELLGLPRDDVSQFTAWAVDTILIFHDPVKAMEASRTLAEYIGAQITARRADLGEDMLSQLIGAEVDGQKLDDQDIINFVRILLPAGAETTSRSTSNLLFALLTQPDQWEALRADPGLIDAAIEEGLRWEAPLTSLNRLATRDVEMAGVDLPQGAIVACNIGAANRDPGRWPQPDEFDLRRAPQPHLAFAFGPHTCLGMHLARLETRVVLEELLRRLPDLHLDHSAPPPEIRGIGFRSAVTLPVRFTPEKVVPMRNSEPEQRKKQINTSDWTDNDLLTIAEAIARLRSELRHAETDLDTLRRRAANQDLVQIAERRIEAIQVRIEQLGRTALNSRTQTST